VTTPEELAAAIDAEVYRQCVLRAEAIDRVCAMALAEGQSGVSVYQDVAFVDPDVPYGHIYQHQRTYGAGKDSITSAYGR
jgi:hypothetical protein